MNIRIYLLLLVAIFPIFGVIANPLAETNTDLSLRSKRGNFTLLFSFHLDPIEALLGTFFTILSSIFSFLFFLFFNPIMTLLGIFLGIFLFPLNISISILCIFFHPFWLLRMIFRTILRNNLYHIIISLFTRSTSANSLPASLGTITVQIIKTLSLFFTSPLNILLFLLCFHPLRMLRRMLRRILINIFFHIIISLF